MAFVVALLIPTAKISAIKRMFRDLARKAGIVAFEVANKLRNSFAFVHEAFNFSMPDMMGKCEAGRGGSQPPAVDVAISEKGAIGVNRPYLR